MIDISQDTLLRLLVRAFLCGVALGLVYEVIRAFKMLCGVDYNYVARIPKRKIRAIFEFCLTFLCDIFFWLLAGIVSIILMYHTGQGFFRGMTYLGLASGFLLYYISLGRLMLKLNAKIVRFIKKVLRRLLRIVYIPIKKLIDLVISLYHLTIGKIIGKIKEEIKRRRDERRSAKESELQTAPEEVEGKESCVYALGKAVYRRQGRVSFGMREDDRA